MLIGINAMAAFTQPRTGVEEYAYQLIKNLTLLEEAKNHKFLLYNNSNDNLDFYLPDNFQIKKLNWPLAMWGQIRLSGELFFNKINNLFIPANALPIIHPENSIITIHGLEYEYCPEAYSKKKLYYLKYTTKYAVKNAKKIIAVSENTKKDLVNLYHADSNKISVIHHGISSVIPAKAGIQHKKYILYIGRIETRKNIKNLIKAFNLLKNKYNISHKLILAGSRGYDFNKIISQVCHPEGASKASDPRCAGRRPDIHRNSSREILRFAQNDIVFTGYVSEDQKWNLLQNADCFVLPSFYEGFGIPILEAQQAGCPVVCSNISSMPEVAGKGAILINPENIINIANNIYNIIKNKNLKNNLIARGYENIKNFSWQNCARETLKILTE